MPTCKEGKKVLEELVPGLLDVLIGVVHRLVEVIDPQTGYNNGVADPEKEDGQAAETTTNKPDGLQYILQCFYVRFSLPIPPQRLYLLFLRSWDTPLQIMDA